MANPLRTVIESDLIAITARVEGIEKRIETIVQESTRQYTEVSNKMAVYEANLKNHVDESRRNNEKLDRNITSLQTAMENIDDKLIKLFDVMGLDGTRINDVKVRNNWYKINSKASDDATTWVDLRKKIILAAALGFLGIIGSGLFLVFKEYIQTINNAPVVRVEAQK